MRGTYSFVLRQATELCGEKAADLQSTLIHMQWQSKHVEQRIMAERATRELDIAAVGKLDETKFSKAAAAAAAAAVTAATDAPSAKGDGESEMGELTPQLQGRIPVHPSPPL